MGQSGQIQLIITANFPTSSFSTLHQTLILFLSFFQLDSITSYCNGWKLGENSQDGLKWEIKIKKDEEDIFWFSVVHYDSNDALESSTLHKYEVIDGLLHFSTSDWQTFIFYPSEKNYAEDTVGTEEIRVMEGCMFN